MILLLKPTSSSNYFLFHSFEPLPVASISQEARCLIKNLDEVQAESGTRSCLPSGHLLPPLSSEDGLLKAGDIPVYVCHSFLPRSKHLLVSGLQSSFMVIMEPKKIKSVTVSIVSPSIQHEAMGLDAIILDF